MTTCSGPDQLLISVIGEPFSHVSMVNSELGVKVSESPVIKSLSDQLSFILKGEAEWYWNMILGWAHKAQFYEAFEKEAKHRRGTG